MSQSPGGLPGAPAPAGAFSLFGFPVRVHGSFLLVTLFIAMSGRRDLVGVGCWLVVVSVSILWHELGHAVAARGLGMAPVITLHGMGGTTSWLAVRPLRWTERIGVSLAGPGVGLFLGLALLALLRSGAIAFPSSPLAQTFVDDFLWVNIGWGVLNLLPILPLDGGNIASAVLEGWMGPSGARAARYLSVAVGLACVVLAFGTDRRWAAFLALLFVYDNLRVLFRGGRPKQPEPRPPY